jgi:hypothetical protein
MTKHFVAASLAAATALGALFSAPVTSQAQPALRQDVQMLFYPYGGHRYCWYDSAWNGPGWYWCGYPWRRGLGWGGAYGWRGWRGGHPAAYYGGHYWDRNHGHGGGDGRDHGGRGDHGDHGDHGGHGHH